MLDSRRGTPEGARSGRERAHDRGLRVAAVFVVLLATPSGCFRASIADSRVPEGPAHVEWRSAFLWGLAGEPEFDVRYRCPDGAARVRAGGDLVATLLGVVTLGIYTPRVVRVTCVTERPPSSSGARVGERVEP